MSCGGGGGGSNEPARSPPPPAPPPTITYTIVVSSGPAESSASVGGLAEATITWSFSASSSDAGSASYAVSSSTSGVQISGGSGSVVPGTSITTNITFSCTAGGTTEAQLTLAVGAASESVTWSITCTEETVSFMPLADERVANNDVALTTLVWRFQTTGDELIELMYEVTSIADGLQLTNGTGSVAAGTDVEHDLRYLCNSVGVHEIALSITIGSATQRVEWLVTCTVEDFTPILAKFHQGPLLAQVEFALIEDSWEATVGQVSYFEERLLRVGSNRRLFVTLEYESEQVSELAFDLSSMNQVDSAAIELVSTSNLAPNISGTRPNYIRRVVFDVNATSLTDLGLLQIHIDPEDEIPQRDEGLNVIEFDVAMLPLVELPELNITLIPIEASHGGPDLSNVEVYIETIYELLPIGPHNVTVGDPLDMTNDANFDPLESLQRIWELWLAEGEWNEFYHGIFKHLDEVEVCGLAHVPGNAGVTGEIDEVCSENTIAHELGHNFSLRHAPACGAESANPDPSFPHDDGSIGVEGGWRMLKRQPVGQAGLAISRVYDVMAYCLETFTSQYSYGKAQDYFVGSFGPLVSASKPPSYTARDFEVLEGYGLVVTGYVSEDGLWSLQKTAIVAKPPLTLSVRKTEFRLKLVHLPSGVELHREGLQPLTTAHGDPTKRTWGSRIPVFAENDLILQIVDHDSNVVFEQEIENLTLDL